MYRDPSENGRVMIQHTVLCAGYIQEPKGHRVPTARTSQTIAVILRSKERSFHLKFSQKHLFSKKSWTLPDTYKCPLCGSALSPCSGVLVCKLASPLTMYVLFSTGTTLGVTDLAHSMHRPRFGESLVRAPCTDRT